MILFKTSSIAIIKLLSTICVLTSRKQKTANQNTASNIKSILEDVGVHMSMKLHNHEG